MRNFDSAPPSSNYSAESEVVTPSENKPLKNYDLVQSDTETTDVVSVLDQPIEISEDKTDADSSPSETQEIKKINTKLQSLLEDLPTSDHRKIESFIKQGRPDKVAQQIAGLGLPMTSQEELIKHFTHYLEDGIKRISWTGKRLAYAVAILEYTLDSEGNKNITSVENLIQNYLIFCKTFKEYEDNKMPRYGQFSYVMRSIFAGITSKEEIEEIIRKHKTFGQKTELTEEELGELHTTAKEVRKDFLEAKKKKIDLDRAMGDALQEEHEEKGKVWSWRFSAPREYEFPNYTFQTGEKKGKNKTVGRSSWEPLFEAYADTVNKNIEDRISKKEGVSDEEKERRIKETRIELLYEKFEFPVGIRTDKNGNSKPIVYILDFVDINRWRGIEIKGPLTPKAAEKIRLFQKYYVDGDFSGLPQDEQIIMMEYVQDALDGVRDYCIKRGHPAFNQFSALDVLGMYKWDYDLNNFNKYEEARYMKELSVKERQQLQKGFIPLIEDRIKTREDFPDIRPKEYVQSDKLPKIEGQNKKDAKKEGASYVIKEPTSTKPYNLDILTNEVVDNMDQGNYAYSFLENKVLDTLPLLPENKQNLKNLLRTEELNDEILPLIKRYLNNQVVSNILAGKAYAITLPAEITEDVLKDTLRSLDLFYQYLINLEKRNDTHVENNINPEISAKMVKVLIKIYERGYLRKTSKFVVDQKFIEDLQTLSKMKVSVSSVFDFYKDVLLGDYRALFYKRAQEVGGMIEGKALLRVKNLENFGKNKETLLMRLVDERISNKEKVVRYFPALLAIIFFEFSVSSSCGALFSIANETLNGIKEISYNYGYDLIFLLEKKFNSLDKMADFFSSYDGGINQKVSYLNVLTQLNVVKKSSSFSLEQKNNLTIFMRENKEVIILMAKILLKNELGEEKYERVNKVIDDKYKEYIKS